MNAPVKLWRYWLPNQNHQGWAEIVICSTGFFGVVSDFGNYSYLWTHHGYDDVRKFFLRAERDWDYFARKLGGEHATVYDGQRTARGIRDFILEQRRSGELTAERAREEWELIDSDLEDNMSGFDAWYRSTKFEDVCEFHRTRITPQLEAFCKVTMARLADVIRSELEKEAAAA